MNFEEVLKLADKIVFTKTGQHLDDLQKAVLRGTLQREKYKEIAKYSLAEITKQLKRPLVHLDTST